MGVGILDATINDSSFQLNKTEEGKAFNIIGTIYNSHTGTHGDKIYIEIDTVSRGNQKYAVRNSRMVLYTDGVTVTNGEKVRFISKLYSFKNSKEWNEAYARRMQRSGIDFYSRIKGHQFSVVGKSKSLRFLISEFKENCIILIDKSSLSKNTGNFLISILLGEKAVLHPEVKETITQSGMAHVLALSGMHVAIIFSISMIFLFPLAFAGYARTRKLAAIFIIWIYVLLTGCAFSTVRAALMITFVVWAFILERKNSPINSLFAAAFFILLFDPLSLWDIGFQMSFLCVASIILFVEKFNPVKRNQHPRIYNLINICLISLVVTLATFTVTLYYFGNIPVLFLPANIILVPLLPIFVGLGILYIVLLISGIDFNFLAKIINWLYNMFVDSAFILSGKGQSQLSLTINEATVFLWLMAVLFLALGIYAARRKNLYKAISATLFCLSIATIMVFAGQDQKSIVFNHSFTSINITVKTSRENKSLTFPRQSFARSQNTDFTITSVDCPLKKEFLAEVTRNNDNRKKYLIIGPNASHQQIADLIESGNYNTIILHANIGARQKENLLGLVDEKHHYKIHSLREDGSLEIYL